MKAMNYHSFQELQEYFDSASAIVYEAFPKPMHGNYLPKEEQGASQSYISHGAHLSLQFAELHRSEAIGTLEGYVLPLVNNPRRLANSTNICAVLQNSSIFSQIAHGICTKSVIMKCVFSW